MSAAELTAVPGITGAERPPFAGGKQFLLGHAKQVLTEPNSFYLETYKELGPVFQVKLLHQSAIVLCGAKANRWCARHEKDFLQSEGIWDGIGKVYGANPKAVIVNNDGEPHRQLREQLKDTMSKTAFSSLIETAAGQFNDYLAETPKNEYIDMVAFSKGLIYKQLGEMLVEEAPDEHLEAYAKMVDAFVLSVTMPFTASIPRIGKTKKAFNTIRKHTRELVDRYTNNDYTEMEPRNFVEHLIQGAQKGFYPFEDLPFLSVGAIVAGIDTLAHSLAFAIYSIASDPAIRKIVQSELESVAGGQDLDVSHLKQLDETRKIIMESMRMYPISPGLRRRVRHDVELGGYQLRAGDDVIVAHAMAHFQDDIYTEPGNFDHTRFSKERRENKQAGAFAPFGVGPHICLGAGMAEPQLLLDIAMLFQKFNIECEPGYQLSIQWIPAGKPKGFNARLVPRK